DVAAELELQGDLADSERTRGRHQLQRGNLPEIALERGCHQRGHDAGAAARQLGSDLNGGEVDLRKRADRYPDIAEQATEHDGHPEERGRDRAVDERRGHAHGLAAALGLPFALSLPRVPRVPSGRGRAVGASCPASSALDTVTCAASVRRAKPVLTTR